MTPWLEFTVPGNPRPWERTGTNRGTHYTPAATRDAEEQVAWEARAAMRSRKPVTAQLSVEIWFHRNTARACDLDNMSKVVLDGAQGHVWVNDSQIVDLTLHKRIDRVSPRTVVRVFAVEGEQA